MISQPLRRPLGEHKVWKEGDRFIKVPTKKWLFADHPSQAIRQLRRNKAYIIRHFSDFLFLPTTKILKDPHYGYRILQKAVDAKPLNLTTLAKDSSLSQKLQKLFDHNYQLRWHTTWGLDFYGTDAFFRPHLLHNILHDQRDDSLWLIDIGILRGNAKNPLFRTMSHMFFHTQNALFMSMRHCIAPLSVPLYDRGKSMFHPYSSDQNSVQDSMASSSETLSKTKTKQKTAFDETHKI